MGKDQGLFSAIKNQDISTVQKILTKAVKPVKNKLINSKSKFNINHQDADGMSYLHEAALMGSTDIMSLLLETGIAVDLKDNKGMIPLHYACWQGKVEPVKLLLDHGSLIDEKAEEGDTPLHLSCQHGHYDVVEILMEQHADPRILNNNYRTPIDLACEFGRFRVVELLLKSNQCQELLKDQADDMVDNNHTTSLHLAAKNGHTDIIKLLLQSGVNINRCTLQGTCLHAAALCGKIDVVRLLLECGADVNQPNSYDQTALDIVNKFTTLRAAKELKALLKEASFAVKARAVKDHYNSYDIQGLVFKEGESIKVLEQKSNGIWKGCVIHNDRMSKPGYFPADHVVLVDSNAVPDRPQSQRLSNPHSTVPASIQMPDILNRNSLGYGTTPRTSHSSTGEDTFPPPPASPINMATSQTNDNVFADSGNFSPPLPPSSYVGNVPSQPIQARVIVNNPLGNDHGGERPHLLGHYNGDIRTTSGHSKDSPVHSNRNSAASTDSGRGISTVQLDATGPNKNNHNFVNIQIKTQHRLSGQSYESGVSSRQSYHSTSSSSLGSLDQLEESGYSSQTNVADLFKAGLPDSEILLTWLRDLRFEEYYHNFVAAGYDMPTISRMTPEDLTAIGITKPSHRKRLKADISRMNIYDGIPDYKPNDLLEWLKLLNMEQYYDTLLSQGYSTIDQLTEITWEDLEEIGIKKLGHQKKTILAIDRLKRIMAGSKRLSSLEQRSPYIEPLDPPAMNVSGNWSLDTVSTSSSESTLTRPKKSASGDSLSQHLASDHKDGSSGDHTPTSSSPGPHQPDLVAIQVKRSLSHSGSGEIPPIAESTDMTGQPITYQSFHIPNSNKRSSDLTEERFPGTNGQLIIEDTTNENVTRPSAAVSPRVMIKPKPVAKISAKSNRGREFSPESSSDKYDREVNPDNMKSFGALKQGQSFSPEHIYDQPVINAPKSPKPLVLPKPIGLTSGSSCHAQTAALTNTTASGAGIASNTDPSIYASADQGFAPPTATKPKKVPPPPPPKRSNSMRNEERKYHLPNRKSEPATPSFNTLSRSLPNSSTHHEEFANCVKSLSERFGKNMDDNDAHDSSSNESDDFPPPPPPLAMDIITPRLHNYGIPSKGGRSGVDLGVNNPPSRVKKDSCPMLKEKPTFLMQKLSISEKVLEEGPSLTSSSSSGDRSLSESEMFVSKRKDSTLSMESNSSNSSVESNTLPFANENIGTIKQKSAPATLLKPSVVHFSEELTASCTDDGASKFSTTENSTDLRTSTLGRKFQQRTFPASQTANFSEDNEDEPPKRPPLPKKYEATASPLVPQRKPKLPVPTPTATEPEKAPKPASKVPEEPTAETGNVLHDIDNMLQNLTEELDAMLEDQMMSLS